MGRYDDDNDGDAPPFAPKPSKDIIVLGTIRHGITKFERIMKMTNLDARELDGILNDLEKRGYIMIREKKNWLGRPKIEIFSTQAGADKVDDSVREMQSKWGQMTSIYQSGDKKRMKGFMDDNRSILPMMLFFGIVDMMMFSMMFSMIGMPMSSYVPAESMPEGADSGMDDGGDGGGDGGDGGGMDGGDGGGFDFDVGF